MPNTLMSLTDASERLGVHYMTAYRYVRTGRLEATKDGGQWRVTNKALQNFQSADVVAPRSDIVPPMLVDRLVAGDENGAFQLLENAMAAGADAEDIYLVLLRTALASIGTQWQRGELSIVDEHIASTTTMRVIARLGPRVAARGRTRGLIMIGAITDDRHAIPTAIMRDLLRSRGFAVLDLGPNTPAHAIIERATELGDELLAIGLASTTSGGEETVREMLTELNTALDVPIVVGGRCFPDPSVIEELGTCHASSSAEHALELFDQIHADARSR